MTRGTAKFIFPAILLILLLVAGKTLLANKIPADQVRIKTPTYAPLPDFKPTLGAYSYTVSWNGIPAGSIDLKLDRSGEDYKITANARTAKGIDLLYRLRFSSEAVVSAETFFPRLIRSVSHENSRRKTTELRFLPDGEIRSTREDDRGKVESMRFHSENFTLDPFSAGFLALSLKWEVGDTRKFDTFTGKSRYLIELTATERTQFTVNGKSREALVIVPKVTKLTDTEPSKKLREAKIYISADNSGEILGIVSDLFFGSVKTKLIAFTPSTHPVASPVLQQGMPVNHHAAG